MPSILDTPEGEEGPGEGPDDTGVKSRRHMTHLKVSFVIFRRTAVVLGLSHEDLCRKLGYHYKTSAVWEEKGEMPQVAGVACEAFEQLSRKNDPQYFVIRCMTQKQAERLSNMVKLLDETIVMHSL